MRNWLQIYPGQSQTAILLKSILECEIKPQYAKLISVVNEAGQHFQKWLKTANINCFILTNFGPKHDFGVASLTHRSGFVNESVSPPHVESNVITVEFANNGFSFVQ